jgi:hypothetical protein
VRFDYLAVRPRRGDGVAATPLSMHTFGGAEHGWPSDHLGIVADLRLTPG